MADQFIGGYGHNEDAQNYNASMAVVVVAGRSLFLVGRYLVWHAWDKGKEEYVKIEGVDAMEMSDEEIAAIKARQPQPQSLPQPSMATVATPNNNKIKVPADGEMQIYSQNPKRAPGLLDKFNNAEDEMKPATCQFGPSIAMVLQEQQDIAQAKLNSVTDGKGQQQAELQQPQAQQPQVQHTAATDKQKEFENWGYTGGGDMNARTNEARLKRIEEELAKTRLERDMYKQKVEQQQQHEQQPTTTTNVSISIPTRQQQITKELITILQQQIVKELMTTIKHGGTVNSANDENNGPTTTITNGYINRRNQTPDSDDSPGDTGDGGGMYQMGNGGGSNGGGSHNGDGGDEPEGGGNVAINRFGGKGEDRGK